MQTVQISDQTFAELQRFAEALVDTPDTVIQRLIRSYKAKDGPAGPRPAPRPRIRARKGLKTPNEAFFGPIVKVLKEAGGRLPTSEAVDRVGEVVQDDLTDIDLQPLKSGELRWRNTVRFARNDLVTQGVLRKDSDFGIWELADQET